MEWAKIEVKLAKENKEPLIGFLLRKGIHQWEENDGLIIYLPKDASLKSFLLALVEFLYKNSGGRWELAVSQIEERDWAREWREAFPPRKVGEKLVIKPPGLNMRRKKEK